MKNIGKGIYEAKKETSPLKKYKCDDCKRPISKKTKENNSGYCVKCVGMNESRNNDDLIDDWCGDCYGEDPSRQTCKKCQGTGINSNRKVKKPTLKDKEEWRKLKEDFSPLVSKIMDKMEAMHSNIVETYGYDVVQEVAQEVAEWTNKVGSENVSGDILTLRVINILQGNNSEKNKVAESTLFF